MKQLSKNELISINGGSGDSIFEKYGRWVGRNLGRIFQQFDENLNNYDYQDYIDPNNNTTA